MSEGRKPLEWCNDYHCAGDCGLLGHGYQHAGHGMAAKTAKTSTERSRAFRQRKDAAELHEVRGIYAPLALHERIKADAARVIKREAKR